MLRKRFVPESGSQADEIPLASDREPTGLVRSVLIALLVLEMSLGPLLPQTWILTLAVFGGAAFALVEARLRTREAERFDERGPDGRRR